MFGIGTGELLLILVIAMLVVGPERMVDYARRGGVLLAKLREQTDKVTKDFRQALDAETGPDGTVNPLAELKQIKSEAEGAVRDIQGVFSGQPTASQTPAAKTVQPATAAQDQSPVVATPPPAPAAHAQGPAADTPLTTLADDDALLAGATLADVELIDDEQGLELGGPVLVEADESAESEAQQ